jgi:hypothetical protein
MTTTKIITIENAITKSFKLSVNDFYNNRIEIEEDFRACFYFHLRTQLGDKDDLKILLSHNIKSISETVKPDIAICRKGEYLAVVEMKNMNKVNDRFQDFSSESALRDIEKMKNYVGHFKRGYFIYFTKSERNFALRNANWKKSFYREFWHTLNTPSIHLKKFEENDTVKTTQRIERLINPE